MLTSVLFSIFQTGDHSNGGVNSITQILENDKTIQPVILTNINGPFNSRWESRELRVITSKINWGIKNNEGDKTSMLRKVNDLFKSNWLAYKLLVKNKIGIVYCNDIQGFWCAYFGGKLARRKIIFGLRDTKSAKELSSLKKWRYMAKNSDVIIVLSEEMKDFVVTKLLDNKNTDKIHVIYSIVNHKLFFPVDAAEVAKERKELSLKEDNFIISYVAAFNEKKAQLAFIENVVSKCKAYPRILFCFIGDFNPDSNPYAKACLDAVSRLMISHIVKFVGYVSNVHQYYKASDLVAIASNKEGLARCMIESISCGTPVISFDVCSAHEILTQHKCGEVAKMDDYEDYFQRIIKLLKDPALMNTYKQNGAAVSKKLFSKEEVLKKYQQVY